MVSKEEGTNQSDTEVTTDTEDMTEASFGSFY